MRLQLRTVSFPSSRTLRTACIIVLIAWIALALSLLFTLVGSIGHLEELGKPAIVSLFVLIFAVLIYIPLAISLKCLVCRRRFLIQTDEVKHENARTKWRLDVWALVVIDVLLRGTFVCMYCGTKNFISQQDSK